jgi:hypothetical protein
MQAPLVGNSHYHQPPISLGGPHGNVYEWVVARMALGENGKTGNQHGASTHETSICVIIFKFVVLLDNFFSFFVFNESVSW